MKWGKGVGIDLSTTRILPSKSEAASPYANPTPYPDPTISKITSPLNANVWKIIAQEGAILRANDTVAILEAMKLEIAVKAEEDLAGSKVEKLLVRPNDVVKAGDAVVLVRRREREG